jgi:hypothetical protein
MSCSGKAQTQNTPVVETGDRIEVLDFHTDHRCKTCLTIENLTKALLANDYTEEMASGLMSFRLINADDKANAAIVEKYFAYGTTLVINTVHQGNEKAIDLTSFAFMNANKEADFIAGMKKHLDASLQKIRL